MKGTACEPKLLVICFAAPCTGEGTAARVDHQGAERVRDPQGHLRAWDTPHVAPKEWVPEYASSVLDGGHDLVGIVEGEDGARDLAIIGQMAARVVELAGDQRRLCGESAKEA